MSKINVAIIEDEYPAARLLSSMIKELRPEWNLELLPGSIEESVEWFEKNKHPDIVFLDIHLTDGNSFLFIERAKPLSFIIFTTAYDQYAVRAFTVNSIDYLLKPIHKERLNSAIERFEKLTAKQIVDYNAQSQIEEVLQNLTSQTKRYRTRFLISAGDSFKMLSVDDIAYFYSENKITFAVKRNTEEDIINLSLDKLTEELDPDEFFRANRQVILNINSISRVEPYFQGKLSVRVNPKFREQILISREKSSAFKLWLNY
ncbi:LytR/AlgR family response regulator transcription factor [Bacteroides coprosuis]|uniref:LytR/AlgR family response regulator transcription factor n=1 Tax=Bacteroides coprosuis TaxID=151276 RepID=UPI001E09031E|nr:LytTR family DNA-binding domain-containing protein [Bacteroides coprosuis]HJD92274.1 LytTR family DNA-binding domain-containing protein [Bacteroides coprosuis]